MTNEAALTAHAKLLGVTPDQTMENDDGEQTGEFRVTLYGGNADDAYLYFRTFRQAQEFCNSPAAKGISISKIGKVMW